MPNVQPQFEEFHSNIRTYYEMNETLREKKDIIVNRITKSLKEKGRPRCTPFIQGSYKMKVGICALPGAEFDIDVGLRFDFAEQDYSATEVRRWVFEAVDGHTETVEEKGSCIRVTYKDGYHVDLVSYAWWDDPYGGEQHRLAHKTKGWRPADPPALVEHVKKISDSFKNTEDKKTGTDQFRRVVRELKRWNDVAILGESPNKPSGLALLLLAKKYMPVTVQSWDGVSDDLAAIRQIAANAAAESGRLTAYKPTPEGEDLLGGLTEGAMDSLKKRFGRLRDVADEAAGHPDPRKACMLLSEIFGHDFPIPPSTETGRKTLGPAVVPSTTSA